MKIEKVDLYEGPLGIHVVIPESEVSSLLSQVLPAIESAGLVQRNCFSYIQHLVSFASSELRENGKSAEADALKSEFAEFKRSYQEAIDAEYQRLGISRPSTVELDVAREKRQAKYRQMSDEEFELELQRRKHFDWKPLEPAQASA